MFVQEIEPRNNSLNDFISEAWDKITAPFTQGAKQVENVQKTAENINTTAQELMSEGKQAMKVLRPAIVILGVELAILLLFSDIKLFQEIKWKDLNNGE